MLPVQTIPMMPKIINMSMFPKSTIAGLMILIVLFMTMCSSEKSTDQPADKPADTTLVWIDTVNVSPGEQARIDVLADLKSPLQGIQLPLIFTGSHFTIDSVSTAGTMLGENWLYAKDTISNESGLVDVGRAYEPSEVVQPAAGTLVSIYVSIDDSSFQHTISVDTTRVVLSNGALHRFVISDDKAVEIVPEFTPGMINITP